MNKIGLLALAFIAFSCNNSPNNNVDQTAEEPGNNAITNCPESPEWLAGKQDELQETGYCYTIERASGKDGKTYFAVSLCEAAVDGNPILYNCEGEKVCVLQLEECPEVDFSQGEMIWRSKN